MIQDILPSRFTFISLLEACADKGTLNEGKRLHVFIQGKELETDIVVANALLTMYGRHCRLSYLRELFDKLSYRNDVTWNVMISNSAQNQHGSNAVDLFTQMLQESFLPNKVTYLSVLDACASQEDISKGKEFHAQIISGCFKDENMVVNSLVNLYSKCNEMTAAIEMFNNTCEHDVVSWSSIIAGFAQQGQCQEALFIFYQMCQDGMMPNKITYASVLTACASESLQAQGKRIHAVIVTRRLECELIVANSLINLYGKCGNLGYAQDLFDGMPIRDTVSWTAMIVAYAQHGKSESALKLFYQMQEERIRPNRVTLLGVLSACNHAGNLDEGLIWFASMETRFGIRATVDHYNCMIDLLGRAGKLDEAEQLVMSTPSQVTIVSLMTLLSACKYQCDVERGERFANHTFALFPNNAEPYVTLANIYSSVGRVADADKIMDAMKGKGIELFIDL